VLNRVCSRYGFRLRVASDYVFDQVTRTTTLSHDERDFDPRSILTKGSLRDSRVTDLMHSYLRLIDNM